MRRARIGRRIAAWALAGLSTAAAAQVDIRVGHGFAAEEQLWLMAAKPEVAPGNGKAYHLRLTAFRANTDRLAAYEAGQLDAATSTVPTAFFAAEQGVPMKAVASLSREIAGGKFHNTSFLVLSDSGIKSPRDLRSRTIGIPDFKSGCDLYARAGLATGGVNAEEVKYVVVPFPAMGQALRGKRIDAGCFPNPFYTMELTKGGVDTLMNSKTGAPFDEDLIVLLMKPEFVGRNQAAVKAFLADLAASTKWYLANRKDARQALIDRKFVQTPPAVYLDMQDYYREPSARITADGMAKSQDMLVKLGWVKKKVDINSFVDNSLLP